MATIINNPGNSGDGSGGVGLWIGIIVIILLIIGFFVYALPAIQGNKGGGSTIKIPDTINVNTGGDSGAAAGGGASTGGGSGY